LGQNASLEVGRLKEKNSALLQQLKRLNAELDSKITNMVPTRSEPVKPEVEESKLKSELECIQKMSAMYAKEIEGLNAKLQVQAGPQKVVDLERELQDTRQQQEAVQREIKATQKRSKDFEKLLAKTTSIKESEVSQLEVPTTLTDRAGEAPSQSH
jgi:chromosome segregation ATPase